MRYLFLFSYFTLNSYILLPSNLSKAQQGSLLPQCGICYEMADHIEECSSKHAYCASCLLTFWQTDYPLVERFCCPWQQENTGICCSKTISTKRILIMLQHVAAMPLVQSAVDFTFWKFSGGRSLLLDEFEKSEEEKIQNQNIIDEQATEKFKKINIRYCPHCGIEIFKHLGCNQMICGHINKDYKIGCGKSFDWSKAKRYSTKDNRLCTFESCVIQ